MGSRARTKRALALDALDAFARAGHAYKGAIAGGGTGAHGDDWLVTGMGYVAELIDRLPCEDGDTYEPEESSG